MTDRPIKSPQPDQGRPGELGEEEEKTDPGSYVQAGYLAQKLEEVLTHHDRKMKNSGWLRTVVATVSGTAIAIAGFFVFVDNRVQAQTDAGIKVHEERITTLEQQRKTDRAELDERLKRIEMNANADHEVTLGTSQKMDKLLERFNVPNPAPAPKDGGR